MAPEDDAGGGGGGAAEATLSPPLPLERPPPLAVELLGEESDPAPLLLPSLSPTTPVLLLALAFLYFVLYL